MQLKLKLITITSALLFLLPIHISAGIPEGYYTSANGLKKKELKTAMRLIISKAKVLNYGSGAGSTWTGFYTTDRMADGQVIDRYSNDKRYFPASASASAASAVDGMNIEHSFPKSWWGGTTNQAYKDLFNLMPCEIKINSSKGNYAMGKVTSVSTDNGCTKVGKGPTDSGMKTLWEPADKWKGDFARDYFYMVTAYSTLSWTSNGLDMLENNEWPTLQDWAWKTLLTWSRQDPIDELEKKRNDDVYSIQGNRNPFVDYPNLAEYIWGDSIDYAFYVDEAATTPDPGHEGNDGEETGGEDAGDQGDIIPDMADLIIDAPMTSGFGVFHSIKADGSNGSIWKYDSSKGAIANAYNNGAAAANEYLLTTLDLSMFQNAIVSFEHATSYNYQNKVDGKYFELLISDDYDGNPQEATWEQLSVNFPTLSNNKQTDYVSSGRVSLESYCGQTVTLAFHYISTTSACYAWQIKNVRVNGKPCELADDSTSDYYRRAEGLRGTQLKQALHDLIQPCYVLSYGGGEGKTWSGFWETDQMENQQVRDRYSNEVRYLNSDLTAVSNMNIEHIWANSWWGHVVNNAYCDLFNLYPADATANGRKSNNPIGIVDHQVAYTNGITTVGKSSSYSADSLITAWEPADQWKGDFARTYFYMATCYSHMTDLWTTTEGLLTVDPKSPLTMRPWVYDMMLEWAEDDPLDEIEIARNEAIFKIQGNRNPFVDYPELCQYIWGKASNEQFYSSKEHGAELFVPMANEVIDLGLHPLSRPFTNKIQVRGRSLNNGLTLSTTDDAFIFGRTDLSAEELTEGYDVPFSVHVTESGQYSTILSLEGSGYTQQTELRIRFVDGIPAYNATDIVSSVSSTRFTAHWMNYEPGATYTLHVYQKDENGKETDFGTYTTTDTTYQVKNIKAATTYYYTVAITEAGICSNEVTVVMPEAKPVFSVSNYDVILTATPSAPSIAAPVSVTLIGVPSYTTMVTTTAPFEISSDGEDWSQSLTLTGSKQSFYVRFGGSYEEGDYTADVTVAVEGLEERIISVTCSVDANKSFFEDFENGSKGAYAVGDVKCTAATWKMSNALIAADDNSRDKKCVRMKGSDANNKGYIEMITDKIDGCDSLWFYAGRYGNDTAGKLTVSYSTDQGQTWTKIVSGLSVSTMKRYGFEVNVNAPIRLKFEGEQTTKNRVNIDDIQMSDWCDPDGINVITVPDNHFSERYRIDGTRALNGNRGLFIQNGRITIVK